MPRFAYICCKFDPFLLNGGGQRNILFHRALCALGSVDVYVASRRAISDEFKSRYNELFGCSVKYISPQQSRQAITDRLKNYDQVVFRYLYSYKMSRYPCVDGMVIDIDDLPWHIRPQPTLVKLISFGYRSLRWAIIWRSIHNRFTKCIVSKSRDVVYAPGAYILPNIPFATPSCSYISETTGNEVLTVGDWTWKPNRYGLSWFVNHCWDDVLAGCPDAKLNVVGKIGDDIMHDINKHRNICIHGYVANLDELYAACAFTIAPVFSGGGTNIKVIESLSRKRTMVLTKHALRGYDDIIDNADVLCANSSKQFTHGICSLLRDKDRALAMSISAYNKVNRRYTFDNYMQRIKGIVESDTTAFVCG